MGHRAYDLQMVRVGLACVASQVAAEVSSEEADLVDGLSGHLEGLRRRGHSRRVEFESDVLEVEELVHLSQLPPLRLQVPDLPLLLAYHLLHLVDGWPRRLQGRGEGGLEDPLMALEGGDGWRLGAAPG